MVSENIKNVTTMAHMGCNRMPQSHLCVFGLRIAAFFMASRFNIYFYILMSSNDFLLLRNGNSLILRIRFVISRIQFLILRNSICDIKNSIPDIKK